MSQRSLLRPILVAILGALLAWIWITDRRSPAYPQGQFPVVLLELALLMGGHRRSDSPLALRSGWLWGSTAWPETDLTRHYDCSARPDRLARAGVGICSHAQQGSICSLLRFFSAILHAINL